MAYDADTRIDLSQYESMIDLIEQSAERYGDKTAYSCLQKTTSFNDVERLSRAFAAYLQHHTPLQKGDRVAIQLPNITQFAIAAYGAMRAGMILVNTNPLYTPRELIHQYNDSGAKALIVLSDLLPTLTEVVAATGIEHVFATHALDLHQVQEVAPCGFEFTRLMDAIEAGKQLDYQPVKAQLNDLAVLQYTGGTTGLSKGAMLSHRNLIANAMQIKSRIGDRLVQGEEVFVAPLPVYHIYAFMVNLVLYFEQGGCSVLIPNPRDISGLIDTLSQHQFTGFAGLNTLFVGLCHQPAFKALDFSRLKVTISGGTALTQAAASMWQQTTGCTISEGYGLSETSPVVSLNAPGLEQLGTIGKPVIETSVKILDMDDNEVAIGEIGELAVSGPQVMQGYWNKPEETAKVMTQDGYFKTGDIALATKDGLHKIVDRKKDMIIVSGFNVYPNEVEDILSSHDAVLECAVVGVSDEHSGEAVKAVIVLADPNAIEDDAKQQLQQYCREQLTAYKVPKIIEFVASLPKSTVGKILRRELRNPA
ncbi:AMP-binding protein [Shewanella waksmanii]|uniref:AMP-binding protein n=1 Tax=Shewanella waksmanii TaxID=213783 RepID=UPI0037365F0F